MAKIMTSRAAKFTLGGLFATGLLLSVSQIKAQPEPGYDTPRYPRFLSNPTPDELLAQARIAVRQTAGRAPLGNIKSGETVYVFQNYQQDPVVWNAVKTAWAERGVTTKQIWTWDILGISKEAYLKREQANLVTGGDGWMEWKVFEAVYAKFLPKEVQATFPNPYTGHDETGGSAPTDIVPPFIIYLKAHPEVTEFFAYSGGGGHKKAILRRHLPDGVGRFKGNWTFETKADLMNKMAAFPSDVWKMIDEEMVRPIAHVSEGWITDPEGTHMHFQVTPSQAKSWDNYAGVANHNPNHLNLYPPPPDALWPEGIVIRAEANHTGYYPTMTVHMDSHAKVTRVEGGGRNGDLFRMMLANPKFRDISFPTAPEPGYWYLAPDGFATNPKAVRDMDKLTRGVPGTANTPERERAGVQHFAFSSPLMVEGRDPRDVAAAKAAGVPLTHTAHMHNYFATVRWRLRDTGEIMTMSEKGHPTIFQNPELRALASKYGNPDTIFSYDWVPGIPGVNEPGDHDRNYGRDPWAYLKSQWDLIRSGRYSHYVDNYKVTG